MWSNMFISQRDKIRVYKTSIGPVMPYTMETRADNKRTKKTSEKRILRNILIGREECQVPDVGKWGRQRRRDWNNIN